MPSRKTKKKSKKLKLNGKDYLSDNVREAMEAYIVDLDGHDASDLYDLFIEQVEKPFFEVVMGNAEGNITKASDMLGMNRGTLRTRLRKYGIY
jgi:Fis family transcriptional regulator